MSESNYPPQPESTNARHRLLQAAAHLFKTKGYERTTVRDIGKAVGIQSGSIFHHFKSKEDILKAVMQENILYNIDHMQTTLANAATTKEKLLALIRCELQSINGETGEAMSVLFYEWRSLSETNQQEILQLRATYEQLWLEQLQRAANEGLTTIEAQLLRKFLLGAISWTGNWFRQDGNISLDELAKQVLKLAIAQ